MRKFAMLLMAVVMLAFISSTAFAGITNVTVVNPDNSGELNGWVTNDILIDFTGIWTGSQILTDVGPGSIYQDAGGGEIPPSAFIVGLVPSAQWDTFMASGSTLLDGPDGNPSPGSWAADLGSVGPATFDTNLLDKSWNPPGGADIADRNGFLIARVTLADTTNSGVELLASAGGDIFTIPGFVENGVISFIPEPSSVALLGLGLIALVGYRRRK